MVTRRGGDAPTMADVARLAAVSMMTVSRVVNGHANVQVATRERVATAIRQLGYIPHPDARGLAGTRRVRIALLYVDGVTPHIDQLLVGAVEQANDCGAQLVVSRCASGTDRLRAGDAVARSAVHGAILPWPLCHDDGIRAMLSAAGVTPVTIAAGDSDAGPLTVMVDDRKAACAMTRHLLRLGHRHIGFVSGGDCDRAGPQCLAGYRDALASVQLPEERDLIVTGCADYRAGLQVADWLLDTARRPSAIFAASDEVAAAIIAVAHGRSVDVPADLTVCGYGDTAMASSIWPQLTTVRQPVADMARTAVRMVMATLGRDESLALSGPAELGFQLVRRQSDAVPRLGHRHRSFLDPAEPASSSTNA